MGQLKLIYLMALMTATLPFAFPQSIAGQSRSKATRQSKKVFTNGVKVKPPEISLVTIKEKSRVQTPGHNTFRVINQAPLIRLQRNYKYKIEVSQTANFKKEVSDKTVASLIILFSMPPDMKMQPSQPSLQNIWERVDRIGMKSQDDPTIIPSEWKFSGDVLLTVWAEPRRSIRKGVSVALPFEYTDSSQSRISVGGRKVKQYVFKFKQDDDVSTEEASVTITPIIESR